MKKIFATFAALAVALITGSAHANLMGSNMTVSITHGGAFAGLSALNDQTYTYGSPSTFTRPDWGSVDVSSPALAPGYDNALKLDFTNFAYSAFAGAFGTTGTAKIQNLAENFDLASVKILVNGMDMTTGTASVANGFSASWSTAAIFAMNPATPNVVVAWNSVVPGPGSLALLGLAGCLASRKRRRA